MALSFLLCLSASLVSAEPFAFTTMNHSSDEDTILIEKENSQKIPYSRIAKALINHVLKVDVQSMFSGGKNSKTACVRSFSEYADRTKYRFGVKKDKVEVKFSLNF